MSDARTGLIRKSEHQEKGPGTEKIKTQKPGARDTVHGHLGKLGLIRSNILNWAFISRDKEQRLV